MRSPGHHFRSPSFSVAFRQMRKFSKTAQDLAPRVVCHLARMTTEFRRRKMAIARPKYAVPPFAADQCAGASVQTQLTFLLALVIFSRPWQVVARSCSRVERELAVAVCDAIFVKNA